MHISIVDLINFLSIDVISYFTSIIGKQIFSYILWFPLFTLDLLFFVFALFKLWFLFYGYLSWFLYILLLFLHSHVFSPWKWFKLSGSKSEIQKTWVYSAQCNTKMLFIKGNWHIVEYSITKLFDFVFLDRHTFEISMTIYFFQVTRLLKTFWATLIGQIRKHKLYLHEKFYVRRLTILDIQFNSEMPYVIQLNL